MAQLTCPKCKNRMLSLPKNFRDTIQCEKCASIIRAVIKEGETTDARIRIYDLDVPDGLPEDLERVLSEAILCYEIGSYAAAIVLSGLFLEGLLQKANIKADRLVDQIKKAHEKKIISTLGFHVATASRLLRNIGAHYSEDLISLQQSDARLVLEMVRKLAADIISSKAIK